MMTNNELESKDSVITKTVQQWLEKVVIGLNLCPFASRPYSDQRVRISISHAASEEQLLEDLSQEIIKLDKSKPEQIETTLLVVVGLLHDFGNYNQFLDLVDLLIEEFEWDGLYQIATFHPDYQFAETKPADAENLTNRAPYPILHIIREQSMEKVLEHYPDADMIPENNISKMKSLSERQRKDLFPYLYK